MIAGDFWTFLGASVLLTLAPGPDILFVLTQGICRGRREAVITALGLCSGVIFHTTAAALGLSAVFHTSALAFNGLKWAGAAYLLFLAYKTLRSKDGPLTLSPGAQAAGRPRAVALFRRGLIMNLLNPKVSLFFLAFLPQFVDPRAGSVALQMIVLGAVFMLQAVVIFSLVGTFAGTVGQRLMRSAGLNRALGWTSAAIFAALGLRLALARR